MAKSILNSQKVIELIIQKAIELAKSKVGTKEVGRNQGPGINEIFKFYGKSPGLPYCTLFVQYCYDKVLTELGFSRIFAGEMSSQTFFNSMKQINTTYTITSNIKPGDIVIWRKFKLWQGHAGLIEKVDLNNNYIYTIEGNTFSSDTGNQAEGDGIWAKRRSISKFSFNYSAFYIRGFVNIRDTLQKLMREL